MDMMLILGFSITGVFLTAKYGAKLFLDQKIPGSIVNVASMSGVIANRGILCSAYNTSKAAVCQMTRNLAGEWGQHGIRVNSLSPGVSIPRSGRGTTANGIVIVYSHGNDGYGSQEAPGREEDVDGWSDVGEIGRCR